MMFDLHAHCEGKDNLCMNRKDGMFGPKGHYYRAQGEPLTVREYKCDDDDVVVVVVVVVVVGTVDL